MSSIEYVVVSGTKLTASLFNFHLGVVDNYWSTSYFWF